MCDNSHIDIFPCIETIRDFSLPDPITGHAQLVTREGTCSLMDHLTSGQFDPEESAQLTGAGWASLVAFCVGIGGFMSAVNYTVVRVLAKRGPKS